ncbi:hypothetical protein F5146DRAFT_1142311 [Armillaria mellea]|nr:hypothetical protein F5146DRAFT_1142311 [Armillaria mellea]
MGTKWYFLRVQQPQELRIATVPPLTPARKPSDKAILLVAPGHPGYPSTFDSDDAILQQPPPIWKIHPSHPHSNQLSLPSINIKGNCHQPQASYA